jgi:GLPGLI family protein
MKSLLIIISLSLWKTSISQNYLVQYSIPNDEKISISELIINDTISAFQRIPEANEKHSLEKGFFIKNTSTGLSYFTEKLMNVTFYVTDSVHNMKWELLHDTLHILNEVCLSARTSFRGRNYIAYYSPKYPISNGPWKFGGLPGLILLVKSTDNYVEWKAEKIIENYSAKVQYTDINKFSFIKWNDFIEKYKEIIDKYIKMVRSNGTLSNGASATMKIDKVEIFYPELQTGTGIKF